MIQKKRKKRRHTQTGAGSMVLLFAISVMAGALGAAVLHARCCSEQKDMESAVQSPQSDRYPVESIAQSLNENSFSREETSQEPQWISEETVGEIYNGQQLGNISIENTDVNCTLFFGDSETQLSKGAGVYDGASIPGEGSTVLVAGHTGSYFRDFEKVKVGDKVTLKLNYGLYEYEVVRMQVAKATDTTAYDLTALEDNIILYTCYPFGQLSETPYRYFIYGKYLSGPKILHGVENKE